MHLRDLYDRLSLDKGYSWRTSRWTTPVNQVLKVVFRFHRLLHWGSSLRYTLLCALLLSQCCSLRFDFGLLIYSVRGKRRLLGRFSRYEDLRLLALLELVIPRECLMEVVVDK